MADKKFKLQEVISEKDEKKWLDFPAKLYKDDPHYVRPMDNDVKKLFDKKTNKLLRNGMCIRYLLYDLNQKIVGRIAAFIDPKAAKKSEQPTGGCGFFDCINDQEAANVLFDAAVKWNKENGMEAIDGPINFGDRDNFWGCLVDGFYDPVYYMPYNFPYYAQLFENYGFKDYFKQLTYRREIGPDGLEPVVRAKAERLRRNPDYSFEIIDMKKIDRYAEDFMNVYNKAWAVIPGATTISKQHAMALLNQLKPIIDPRLMHFAYYKGEPIAFFLMMIDMNQIYKGLNGKSNWFNTLRIAYRVKIAHKANRVISLAFGIVPEHRGRGIDGGLVISFENYALNKDFKYKDLQLNWIGDFNPSMCKISESIGAKIYKTHITYRYLFDREKPFTRAKLQK